MIGTTYTANVITVRSAVTIPNSNIVYRVDVSIQTMVGGGSLTTILPEGGTRLKARTYPRFSTECG
jgi:hypothetical protein